MPPEYRAQYAAKLAEAATPQTRRDILTAAEIEAKRRAGEPVYFRYPEVSQPENENQDGGHQEELQNRENSNIEVIQM